jgi:hypothetical protein
MKRAVAVLSGLLILCIGVNVTFGRPDYRKQFEDAYKGSKIASALQDAKCNVCHYGKEKKNRNDYGVALSKLLTEKSYKELKTKPEELNKKIKEAFKKVSTEKSSGGKTFGELIDAGKLPGTPPAGAQ